MTNGDGVLPYTAVSEDGAEATEVQALNPIELPLFGARLIEASAGTGKTYTLAILYLRLLLGLGGEHAFPRLLSVQEILVVTFTEAATEELRERIRQNIHDLRIACVRGESEHDGLSELLNLIHDRPAAIALLLAAERQMDEAAIYTIHGFCQRMLTQNAFESGILFEQTLVQDEQPLRRQATADFWRRRYYPLPLSLAKVVNDEWRDPDALLADLRPYLQGELPALKQEVVDFDEIARRHQQNIETIDRVKRQWRDVGHLISDIITQSSVDKRSYSSRNLPLWLRKVGEWADSATEDYQIVREINYFSRTTLIEKTKSGGQTAEHPIFAAIEALLAKPISLREILLARALSEVRQTIRQEKRKYAKLGFDDLLGRLDAALQNPQAEQLATLIRQRYPVAMIDEFQDTDPQQYRIFSRIYLVSDGNPQPESGLLLIGDPKQAIYAFRGADIFTYMQARRDVQAHYTMATNWRSSPEMVASVNRLFSASAAPFIFSQIPFLAVQSSAHNRAYALEFKGEKQPALRFWLQDLPGVGSVDYQSAMAHQCAAEISNWLAAGQLGQCRLILDGNRARNVSAQDIAILVRTGQEAAVMRDALSALAIPSVYLSNRESVFTTPEAKDLLWILQAVLAPEKERLIRSALATSLLGLNAEQIDALNQDEKAWDRVVYEFGNYRQHWTKYGVLPMLQQLMTERCVAENLLAGELGERRLTDILHIGELLQEASLQLESENALVRWLAQQISQPNDQVDSQQLRLESDSHLVKIVTIHKSKGLQYPLVWLPFICSFRQTDSGLYHDRTSFQAVLDLQRRPENVTLAEEERLAEDLRLLYVALTRSIFHCSVGIAPLFSGNRRKEGVSDLHKSALGYLIQNGQPADGDGLRQALDCLNSDAIQVRTIVDKVAEPWIQAADQSAEISARTFSRHLKNHWRVTSYSGLQQHGRAEHYELVPNFDIDALGERSVTDESSLTPFSFAKGAAAGTFLHSLLEPLDFTQPIDSGWLRQQMTEFGLEDSWLEVLQHWLSDILTAPLDEQGVRLADICPQHKQAELQFYLPIHALLQADKLDKLIKRYDPLSAVCPPLNFSQVKGMLKGFIDLVFYWQGRYYVLDFKSNWLGNVGSSYHQQAMEHAMAEHRYDLQYQLYSLALHRYLRHRLADYDYERHFGGVYYLFLRGMTPEHPGQGVFNCRPAQALIEEMDRMFEGQEPIC
jgi:exodeoxyribonuclease V beta subunit